MQDQLILISGQYMQQSQVSKLPQKKEEIVHIYLINLKNLVTYYRTIITWTDLSYNYYNNL